MMTICPSFVKRTSVSIKSAPKNIAFSKARVEFSGAKTISPLCDTTHTWFVGSFECNNSIPLDCALAKKMELIDNINSSSDLICLRFIILLCDESKLHPLMGSVVCYSLCWLLCSVLPSKCIMYMQLQWNQIFVNS